MKILVIDDKGPHLVSAITDFESLGGHEVTTCDRYDRGIELLKQEQYDLVLLDMLMPASAEMLGPDGLRYIGQQIGIGLILIFAAAAQNVPNILMLTDANHHNHPLSAALDHIAPAYWDEEVSGTFQVNSSKVVLAHAPLKEDDSKDWLKAAQANGMI